MKKGLLTLLALLPVSTFAATDNAAEDLAKHLNFTSYTANFVQSLVRKKNYLQRQSAGNMALLRPSYFRWESFQPTHQILIADKNSLQIYDVDLMQVTKEKVNQSQAFNPARLLSISPSNLQQEFTIKHANLADCGESFSMRDLKSKDSPLVYLCFTHNRLVEMRMINNLGEATVFSFGNIKINPKLKPDTFKLKLPAGVDVVQR